jgi:hypothetical protein
MREQDGLTEALLSARRDRIERHAGEQLIDPQRLRRCGQRHQARQRLGETQAEAPRHIMGESRCTHFRDRQSARRQHERWRGEDAVVCLDAKIVAAGNIGDGMAHPHVDANLRAFVHQHGDDGARGAVAEQLAQRLLVVRNAMALDQRNKIVLRVARQRRSAEARIVRQEPIRRAVQIREIAATAAGDQDFLSDRLGVIEQQHRATALAGGHGAHQPGSPGS